MRRTITKLVLAVAVITSILFAPLGVYAEDMPLYFKLTILHTNDAHGQLFPFDYGSEKNVGGIARRGGLIQQLKSDADCPVLVMDAGDVFTRGPLSIQFQGKPDIDAMNTIHYDVMTLGNNEFKGASGIEGQKVMRERIQQARFPIVSANVIDNATGKTLVPPYVILEACGRKIGIFGLTAPRVAEYESAKGLTILDPITTAKKIVSELREQVDVIIALTHISYELDTQLAKESPEIDVIVGGDSHTWLDKPVVMSDGILRAFWVGGPVIVQDGEFGKCLGRVDLYLRRAEGHDYDVMSVKGELLPVTANSPELPAVQRLLLPYTRDINNEQQ